MQSCFGHIPPLTRPVYRPASLHQGREALLPRRWVFFCLFMTFALAVAARLLELPFWHNPAYSLNGEHLLATHDAYHWVAGAEGFEFGAGHPMSELLRLLSGLFGSTPAHTAFWLPPFMSGLVAVAAFLWCWGLGRPFAGLCSGVLLSLAPAFCARTMLGFYDTDLVILFFAVSLGLIPALWLAPWLHDGPWLLRRIARFGKGGAPARSGEESGLTRLDEDGAAVETAASITPTAAELRRDIYSPVWTLPLLFSGLFAHWMQEWHSLFPYLVRFSLALLPLFILVLGRRGARSCLLRSALCHGLPLVAGGWAGLFAGGLWAALLALARKDRPMAAPAVFRLPLKFLQGRLGLAALWGLLLYAASDLSVLDALLRSFASYADRGGDMSSLAPALEDPLIFPAVTQSIIEVQTISPREMLLYYYPQVWLSCIALLCFLVLPFFCPAFVWLAPLGVLSLLSLKMGARMTMFGPAALFPALCIMTAFFLEWAANVVRCLYGRRGAADEEPDEMPDTSLDEGPDEPGPGRTPSLVWPSNPVRALFCLIVTLLLAWPLARYIPDFTQGPILSREQAEALRWLKDNSEPDALVWNWWDWGYATHHFARRHTIADGARHGGPSLYLPAAVYTTADPRFARQIIKHTALRGNVPGKVFEGLTADGAQSLMEELGDPSRPLVKAEGKQYLVASFELLRLGLWVTRYGSWNFRTRQGPGALMNNLTPALSYNVDTGVILSEGAEPVYASEIVVFGGPRLERFSFRRYGAYNFLFNVQSPAPGSEPQGPVADFWRFVRGPNILSSFVTDKMAMDEVFFNTMMVQLLIRNPDDPEITPYFRLVFDNVYTRVYEVL